MNKIDQKNYLLEDNVWIRNELSCTFTCICQIEAWLIGYNQHNCERLEDEFLQILIILVVRSLNWSLKGLWCVGYLFLYITFSLARQRSLATSIWWLTPCMNVSSLTRTQIVPSLISTTGIWLFVVNLAFLNCVRASF